MRKKDAIIEMCEDIDETLKAVKKEEEKLLKTVSLQSGKSKRRQKSIVAHRI